MPLNRAAAKNSRVLHPRRQQTGAEQRWELPIRRPGQQIRAKGGILEVLQSARKFLPARIANSTAAVLAIWKVSPLRVDTYLC